MWQESADTKCSTSSENPVPQRLLTSNSNSKLAQIQWKQACQSHPTSGGHYCSSFWASQIQIMIEVPVVMVIISLSFSNDPFAMFFGSSWANINFLRGLSVADIEPFIEIIMIWLFWLSFSADILKMHELWIWLCYECRITEELNQIWLKH